MKKFTIPCNFGGQVAPVTFIVGTPEREHHPLHHQATWLSSSRGGAVPPEVMKSFADLFELSKKNNVPFEELASYALESVQASKNLEKQKQKGEKKSKKSNKAKV